MVSFLFASPLSLHEQPMHVELILTEREQVVPKPEEEEQKKKVSKKKLAKQKMMARD